MSPSETFLRLCALAPRDGSATRDEAADEPPPGAAVERAFGLRFGRDAEHPAPRDDDAPCAPEVDARGRVSCACAGCARWKSYLDGALGAPWPAHPQYEVLVREHVRALAAYLRRRARELLAPGTSPLVVLEVGAGDGRLARHLTRAVRDMDAADPTVVSPTVVFFAVDDHSSSRRRRQRGDDPSLPSLRRPEPPGPQTGVLRVDALVAIANAGTPTVAAIPIPDVVLCCWQPMGVDWTAAMRARASVREYVLVGETDDGICGEPWATWGSRTGSNPGGELEDELEDEDEDEDDAPPNSGRETGFEPARAPYEVDGFERVELPEVSRGQICRTDERWWGARRSRTVSFRRVGGDASGAPGASRGINEG